MAGEKALSVDCSRLGRTLNSAADFVKVQISGANRSCSTYTTDTDSIFYYYWLWITSVAYIYNAVIMPTRASFTEFNSNYLSAWLVIDYCFADMVYVADIFIKARTRFYRQGIAVYDVKELGRRYMRSWEFVFDVISVLPTDLMYASFGFDYVIVRLNRLLRYGRLFEMMTRVENETLFPNLFRIMTTVFMVLLAILYTTIFYHSYSKAIGFADSDADFQLSKKWADQPLFPKFMRCLFWGTMMLCFLGEQSTPQTPLQSVIEITIWLLGLSMFGFMVGRIGEILDNMSSADDDYNSQLDSMRDYLESSKVPKGICDKIVRWFTYAYENHVLGSADEVLEPVTTRLIGELAMDMHYASLKKVALFADLETSVITELVSRLQLQVFSPQDYVCRKGDIGREMYVVKRGSLEVVSDDGNKVFVTLGPGTVFGEISLLSIPGSRTGNKRTANVRSKGYSDLFSLSKEDLYKVLADYPGAMQRLVDKGSEILRKEKKLDEEAVIRQQNLDDMLSAKVNKIKTVLEDIEYKISVLTSGIEFSQQRAGKRLDSIERQLNIILPPQPEETKQTSDSETIRLPKPKSMIIAPFFQRFNPGSLQPVKPKLSNSKI